MSRTPLSGTPVELEHGEYRASIASVGATLRSLTFRGRDLVVPFEADEVRPAFRGATLAPWPNRVVDGVYTFDGTEQLLAHTEPKRSHALHGLVAWQDFEIIEQSADAVTLRAIIPAQVGYPFQVHVVVDYVLSDDGLTETVTGHNAGETVAPWGTGPHPYLVAGAGRVNDWSLELPAAEVLAVTPDRLIPTGLVDVASEGFDFRAARTIGDTFIDHAFTGFETAAVTVRSSDGSGVRMTWDAACSWVQVHTADQPTPELDRLGLAVEPMTCAPDAFNSGAGLVRLEPGERHAASWTIAAVTA
ncbi:aldose 1-epimerase family protein [Microbacteriaceae bacterium VKM Ac-2855]|nr:aldose 1-epimerase family protein [Microbacteriaceae bacterium VKM Ac-2855]